MSNVIVRVSRPELSPEERERRLASIKTAATQLLLAAEKCRKDDKNVRRVS